VVDDTDRVLLFRIVDPFDTNHRDGSRRAAASDRAKTSSRQHAGSYRKRRE